MELMPFHVPRLIGADGKLLPGGRYDFFQAGTTTPKSVYDANGTSLGTSVVVDAGASKLIYLGTGAYKIIAYNASGVQIGPPADNITSSGLGPDSTGSICVVANYAALRGMTQNYDCVVVLGRSTQNDGGEGIFYKSSITNADDDGTVLLRGTTRYKRELPGYIDPLWFGVEYGTTADQATAITATRTASVTWGIPMWILGEVYIASTFDMVSGSSLILDGAFSANEVGPSVRFLTGSRLLRCASVAFSSNVQPVFAKGTVDAVRLSWMGGETTNDAVSKLNLSATANMTAIIDTSAVYSGTVSLAANWVVDPSEGLIEFDNSVPGVLSIVNLDESRISTQVFKFASIATVGTVTIQNVEARPEWFGAIGNGTADDSLAFYAAAKNGRIKLVDGKVYNLGTLWGSTPSPLYVNGGSIKLSTGKTLGTGVLSLKYTQIVKLDVGNWFAGTSLSAVASIFPATYTATTKNVDGCDLGDTYAPMFDGKPKLYNGHVDIASAQVIGTNSVGKLIDGKANLPASAAILGTDPSGVIVDKGTSPTLDMLQFAKMFFTDWSVSPLSGTLTLTNPLKFIYMVDNTSAAVDITLSVPGSTDSTVVIFFPKRRTTNLVTLRGNFPTVGTTSVTTLTALLLYYDRASAGWYFIHSDT